MRILFLTSRLPYPPNRGDRLRVYNFIKSLSRQHEVHLVSFIAAETELANIEPLKLFCKDVRVVKQSKLHSLLTIASNIWRPFPLQALYYRSSVMQAVIDEYLSVYPFDMIYVHLFRMAQFVNHTQHIYRVVDLTDVISREIKRSLPYRGIASRILYTFEHSRIHRYEHVVATNHEEIWLISNADRQELIKDCPRSNIQVVTNGVDMNCFFPKSEIPQPHSIIFSGHFGVAHNIDTALVLAHHVLPCVQRSYPDCTLSLIGAEPSPEVSKLSNLPRVSVTGFVPDLNQHLNCATVFAAPIRFAAGIQNKVLEAMATARPVITTSIVNEGIGAKPGEELIIADSSEEMAKQIIRIFENPEMAYQMGQSALRFVSRKYSWDLVLTRVNEIENNQKMSQSR